MIFNSFFRGIFIISLIFSSIHASFILENDDLLPQKSIDKMNEMANELKDKTGISVYAIAKKSLDEKSILEYGEEYSKKLTGTYALFIFAESEKKVNILSSTDLNSKFDEDEILDDYVIPILVSKDKTHLKYTAAIFNGYAELTDQLAKSNNLTLKSSIGDSGKEVYNIVNYVFWTMIFSFILIFIYVFKRKS